MKFLGLALDFDGTVASDGRLDPDVREAVGELRAHGIVVILVTGRILNDLRGVCEDLNFVDAIVGENGAVIEFPASGCSKRLGQAVPAELLGQLTKVQIPYSAGESIIDADAAEAAKILAILRQLEMPMSLAFNRGRVMVLPQSISKATGLREVLKILRLSAHNTLAIGDAENDHELLALSEVGVAVAWGSEALKQSADYVVAGDGPSDVARFIRALGEQVELPAPVRSRRRLLLGHTDEGRALSLAIRGRNVLVTGDPKSGKSWVTGLLCEQLILYGYSLCILDPEGDYLTLEALPGVVLFGGSDPLPRPRELVKALRHADVSVVIDMSHTPHREKLEYVHSVLPALAILRRRTGLPHRIVLDEAHYFLQGENIRALIDLELNGYTLVTYRASTLASEVLAAAEAVIVTRESDPREIASLQGICKACGSRASDESWSETFERLVDGEAVALPITDEAQGEARRIRLAPRLTAHVRHLSKYTDVPVPESRGFVFWHGGYPTGERARTLREFVDVIEGSHLSRFAGHLRRKDFSRWVNDVFGDRELAKTLNAVEESYADDKSNELEIALLREVRCRYDLHQNGFSAK